LLAGLVRYGLFFLCSRWRGRSRGTLSGLWATINLGVVGAGPEALSGRRLVDFFYQRGVSRDASRTI